MLPPKTMASVFQGEKLVSQHELTPGEYVIGAGDGAQIRIEGGKIDSRHAKLNVDSEGCVLEDLGSRSGTYVNGQRMTGPQPISATHVIGVADLTIRVHRARSDEETLSMAPMASTVRLLVPDELRGERKYTVGGMVAHGGMGIIMNAFERATQRSVAMKVMQDCRETGDVKRFVQEAQITAALEHPNIVPVHELGVNAHDQPFYTMKLVKGTSLKKVFEMLSIGDLDAIERYPLTALLTIFQKICDAVAFAHSRGVIHRDLKPDNIMLGEYGEVLVMDWGLAKKLGEPSSPDLAEGGPESARRWKDMTSATAAGTTLAGTVLGTPQYMSPEQARGENDKVDKHSDLYSLGAILYHLLVLQPPFSGKDSEDVLSNVRAGRLLPPAIAAAGKRLPHLPGGRVPDSLAPVALKAMSLDPAQRYQRVTALQHEIEAFQTGFATAAEEAGAWKLIRLFVGRHLTLSIAAAVLLLAGIIFTINVMHARDRATAASIAAQKAKVVADEQRAVADSERNVAEDRLYSSHMLQAGRHIVDGRPESAWELVSLHQHEPSGRELRNWEWYYALGQLNQDRLRVRAHQGGVLSLAATRDGLRLVTGGGDGTVAIWKIGGLVFERRFTGADGPILSVSWDPTGHLVAAGSENGTLTVWNADTGDKVASTRLPSHLAVRSVVWQPIRDRQRLAVGGLFPEVLFWYPIEDPSGSNLEPFLTTKSGIGCLDWSEDGQMLAVGELENARLTVKVLSVSGRKLFEGNLGVGSDAFTVAIDPTGKYVAAGSKNRYVTIYEIANRRPIVGENLHRGFVSSLAWSPDGSRIASASHDSTLRLFSPFDKSSVPELLCSHAGQVNSMIWIRTPNPGVPGEDDTELISGSADGTLRVWGPHGTEGLSFPASRNNWISAARWNPQGRLIAMTDFGPDITILDPDSGQRVTIPSFDPRLVLHDVAWSPDGMKLATVARTRGVVEIFDAMSGKLMSVFDHSQGDRVEWSPSGRYLAVSGADGVLIWDDRQGRQVALIRRAAGSVAWNSDERHLAVGGTDGAIEIWDGLTGTLTARWRERQPAFAGSVPSEFEPPRAVFDLEWSPDKKFLAYVTQDSLAGLLDGETGQSIRVFSGHASGIWRLAWSPDSRRIATCGQDGTMRIFNALSGDQVAHIDHGDGKTEVHSIDWSADGRELLTGGYDHFIRIWDAGRGMDVAKAEKWHDLHADSSATGDVLARAADLEAKLGWAGDARLAYSVAEKRSSDPAAVRKQAEAAEGSFQTASARMAPLSGTREASADANSRIFVLLDEVRSNCAAGRVESALAAYRSLSTTPGSAMRLPLAQRYLSRARWNVTWFPYTVDPEKDLQGWRDQHDAAFSINARAFDLSFPYQGRAPRDLPKDPDALDDGPARAPFGMIAKTQIQLAPGKWRFQIHADGGVRLMVNGKPVIERWQSGGFGLSEGDYEQPALDDVTLEVENFVPSTSSGFDLVLVPVTPAHSDDPAGY